MRKRQTIREHWDIGVWVTAIGLILGWLIGGAVLLFMMIKK